MSNDTYMSNIDFNAIDFETATRHSASICEAGICAVRAGRVVETRSWLVRPKDNKYSSFNISIHGILPEQTQDAPEFPEVWSEISAYLAECPVFVAHNAEFDMRCIRRSLRLYGITKPEAKYFCSLRAARRFYSFPSNSLANLCNSLGIDFRRHHRAGDDAEMCARLFLREMADMGVDSLEQMRFCRKKL